MGGDAPEMFDAAEEALDEVALFVERGIEGAARGGAPAARDYRDGAGSGDGVQRALPVIALVGEDEAGADAIEQRFDLGDVVALAAGQQDAQRKPERIGDDMNLGAQPTPGAAERVSLSPLLGAPALCWWARMMVESTNT